MTEISSRERALAYSVESFKGEPAAAGLTQAIVERSQAFLTFLEGQVVPAGTQPETTPAETPKKRGRPPKTEQTAAPTTAAAEPAPPAAAPIAAVTAVADFLDAEPTPAATPVREYTKDEVRNCLVAYGNLTSQAKARELMELHGKSATVSGIAKEHYAAVVSETKKAFLAAGGAEDKWPVK